MEKEIDIRSLMVGHLDCKDHQYSLGELSEKYGNMKKPRNFNNKYSWTGKKATYFIESLFLGYQLQPITIYTGNKQDYIIDGLNRCITIHRFINNKLTLSASGIKRIKFLVGKRFKDLDENVKEHFKDNLYIRCWEYYYSNPLFAGAQLSDIEEEEIQKQIYARYNTEIKLSVEEIQKAQFQYEPVTQALTTMLQNKEELYTIACNLHLDKKTSHKNFIENILVNCRLLIAATYSSIHLFSKCSDIQERTEKCYLPTIEKITPSKIVEEFMRNIEYLNELTQLTIWNKYPILHTKYFIEVTYWLISCIRKDNLIPLHSFNFEEYLTYFGTKEEEARIFSNVRAFYSKDIYNRYYAVAQYFEENYGISLQEHFKEVKNPEIIENISDLLDLKRKYFQVNIVPRKISSLLYSFEQEKNIIRPFYQRIERGNILFASKFLESIFLNIRIPYFITYYKDLEGTGVTEMVDGQQRSLNLLAFLGKYYINQFGEKEFSIKNNFRLTGLDICNELNGKGGNPEEQDKDSVLSSDKIKKIIDTDIYVANISQTQYNDFNANDHFVRINTYGNTMKRCCFLRWNVTKDRYIMARIHELAQLYEERLLPLNNGNMQNETIVTTLAYYFYQYSIGRLEKIDIHARISQIDNWLEEFNIIKSKLINTEEEKIASYRSKYFDTINQVEDFFKKIGLWLKEINLSFTELVARQTLGTLTSRDYISLFYLLSELTIEDLQKSSIQIKEAVVNFFYYIHENKLSIDEIHEKLEKTYEIIAIYNSNKKKQYKKQLVAI